MIALRMIKSAGVQQSTSANRGHDMKNQQSPMSEIDVLVEVAKTLSGARSLAETCSQSTLLYFIDMAIFEACEALASAPNAQCQAEGRRLNPAGSALRAPCL